MNTKIEKEIIKIIQKICGLKKNSINLTSNISKIKNWDSLNNIRIFIEISKLTGKKITPNQVQKIKSIKDIVNIIKRK
tara:strand:- start:228 stop:461 length:234 start_codon:yes stop_codon:yes gene_type:complete